MLVIVETKRFWQEYNIDPHSTPVCRALVFCAIVFGVSWLSLIIVVDALRAVPGELYVGLCGF